MLKSSKIIILNQEEEILLYKRTNNKKIPYPGYWDIFGGRLNKGETPYQGLIRELEEEIGIIPESIKFLDKILTKINKKNEESYVYKGYLNKNINEINLNEGEKDSLKRFKYGELGIIKLPKVWYNFINQNKEKIFEA